jgi:putative ABC transport system permease protein
LVDGSQVTANARLSEGGWIALSEQIAKEHHVGIGGVLALATPTGERRFRVAATTTNLAWSQGVIFIGTADFSRTFASATPTALAVDLRSGVDVRRARKAIARALGPSSGLEVSLASEREASINTLTGEGLGQLGEISTLLLIAAIAAMAAALASSIWQRRAWLAGLRLSGARPRRLRRILLAEATLMLGAGCLTGAIAGLYGEVVIDAYLKSVTGFPLASGVTLLRPLGTFALVLALALLIVAIPGWLASRVSPSVALGEQ